MLDALSAAFLGAQCLILLVAAIVAWRQLGEATKSREQQTRPFVVVDFEIDNNQLIFIVISNVGRTVARDVRFEFDPPLASAIDDVPPKDPPFREAKLIREGIRTLAPGRRIPAMFDFAIQRHGKDEFPDEYDVTITYKSADGTKSYTDHAVLDLGIYWNLMHVGRKDVDDIHARLKELVEVFQGWKAQYGHGLHVVTDTEHDARADAFRAWRSEQRKRRQGETPPTDSGHAGEAHDPESSAR